MIHLFTLLAGPTPDDPIGKIEPSVAFLQNSGIDPGTGQLTGIFVLINSLLRIVFIGAGLWGLINVILAGFDFMNASGDPKKVASAWEKIWKTLVGLLIMVASFLIAAIAGLLFFGNPLAILQPTLK
ncbi:MAG TPA: hypothetical protein VJ343_02410 [archaeon]|nr:hypothetical protein [archaeon]